MRKVTVSSSVDISEIAKATDGFSGADLQALVYNANLEAIHSSVAQVTAPGRSVATDEEIPLEYTSFGGSNKTIANTLAQESAFQRRVSRIDASSAVGVLICVA